MDLTEAEGIKKWQEYMEELYKKDLQFSLSVLFDSLPPHGLHHARLSDPSPTPGACSNSGPSSW